MLGGGYGDLKKPNKHMAPENTNPMDYRMI